MDRGSTTSRKVHLLWAFLVCSFLSFDSFISGGLAFTDAVSCLYDVCYVSTLSQILTGILLAVHYTPEINYAYSSVMHILREVYFGWA